MLLQGKQTTFPGPSVHNDVIFFFFGPDLAKHTTDNVTGVFLGIAFC
jgi:hypothetical protein